MTARNALLHGCILIAFLAGADSATAAGIKLTPATASPSFELASSDTSAQSTLELPDLLPAAPSHQREAGIIQIVLIITVLSLAPALIVLLTCFTRIIVVLSMARQALGTAQLPPTQILFGLSIVLTLVIMGPTFSRVNDEALQPYLKGQLTASEAVDRGQVSVRAFMIRQIKTYKNESDVWMFLKHIGPGTETDSEEALASGDAPVSVSDRVTWADVPTRALVPAFVISELKVAFLMGFKIYLPFLVIDMVVASILISMGMLMLPPVLVSLPFKILLFVLVNGWHLLIGSLLQSFT